MTIFYRFSLLLLIFCGLYGMVGAQCNELVWSDEFDYEGLPDPEKWDYDVGGEGWGNNELQYYTEDRLDNARVEDGKLIIEAIREHYNGNNYTSARIVSRGKGDWLYGKIEVRAKLPSGRGTWPAIWMLPTDWEYGGWPESGEIDIMEHVGYDQGRVHATVHTGAYNHVEGTQVGTSVFSNDVSDVFHVYTLEWFNDRIQVSFDDETYFTFDKEDGGFEVWPFDKRFHLLLNIAVGGNWGGAQGIDDTIFDDPEGIKLEIDYVRVYQSPDYLTITGNDHVVEQQTGTVYSLPFAEGVSYHWVLPEGAEIIAGAGTNEITVDWGCNIGNIICEYTTACATYEIIKEVSYMDQTIAGADFADASQSELVFDVPEVTNGNYTWQVPSFATIISGQGTSEIHVQWGEEDGEVSVEVTNDCGTFNYSREIQFRSQSAYPDGTPHRIPGTINATSFDDGGEGVAYHDNEPENQGPGIRQNEGVDTENGDGGNPNIGWTEDGEWLEYSIGVSRDDVYRVSARVASNSQNAGSFSLKFGNEKEVESGKIAFTGGWTSFETIDLGEVMLSPSDQFMRLEISGRDFNVSDISFESVNHPLSSKEGPPVVKLYPNPLQSNWINIDGVHQTDKLRIVDLSGHEMRYLPVEYNNDSVKVNMSSLDQGIYFVEVMRYNSKTSIMFVKQ